MASACVNNIAVSPETFAPRSSSSFSWLSPRIPKPDKKPDPESSPAKDTGDFEFRLHDQPVIMLPADELFSDGKLMPLQLKPAPPSPRRKLTFSNDPYLFSPKAPRCSSRWRELLGFKKLSQKQVTAKTESSSASSSSTTTTSTKSLRLLLYKNSSKTTSSSSSDDNNNLSLPLLNSNHRLSLSSSDDNNNNNNTLLSVPRLSVDSSPNPPRLRTGTRPDPTRMVRGASVDSPRMNASGRVLFQGSGLERSSSSPSSFNGGRPNNNSRYRGMEQRSYSANVVRVTPVLNVPVCSSLRGSAFGFGQLFSSSHSSANHSLSSSQKRESGSGTGGGNGNSRSYVQHHQQQTSSCSRSRKESL